MKQLLFPLLFLPCLALAQYPANANQKITLGEQTTADGLVYRGLASNDTIRKPSVDTMAYMVLDTTTNLLWHYKKGTSNAWLQAGGSGGGGGGGTVTSITGGTGLTGGTITSSGTLAADTSFLFTQSDTTSLNLTSRFAAKQNTLTLTTTGSSGAATLTGATLNIPQYSGGGISDGDKGDIDVTNSGATWTIDTSAISLSGNKVTGTLPVANGGTGAVSFTSGNILFGNGTSAINTSSNFYYDVTNNRLGIGATPAHILDLRNNINGTNTIQLSNTSTGAAALHGIICTQEVSINDKWGGFFYTNSGYTGAVGTASTFFMEGAGTGGLYIGTRDASGIIRFASGNRTERMRLNSNGEFNIGYDATDNGAYKLQVKDSVYVGGNVSASAYTTRSDYDLKDEIQNIGYGINEVMQMQPVKYTYKSNGSTQLGFIAQDLGVITPEVVSFEDKMSVYYNALIPILTKAIQEQQALIKALEQRILTLENK